MRSGWYDIRGFDDQHYKQDRTDRGLDVTVRPIARGSGTADELGQLLDLITAVPSATKKRTLGLPQRIPAKLPNARQDDFFIPLKVSPRTEKASPTSSKLLPKLRCFDNNDGNSKAFLKHLRSISSTSTRIGDVQILAPGTVASAITRGDTTVPCGSAWIV
jgi:hypothetical protein